MLTAMSIGGQLQHRNAEEIDALSNKIDAYMTHGPQNPSTNKTLSDEISLSMGTAMTSPAWAAPSNLPPDLLMFLELASNQPKENYDDNGRL